ncbi:hypothetical protein BH10ACI2_BH10ACI2_24180 [soil metagenome]
MKSTYYLVAGLLFTISLSVSALAQSAPGKFVLINTAGFYDEKAGITKLVAAEKTLDLEFANQIKALQADSDKVQAIAVELQRMQTLQPTEANRAAMTTKQEEGERLQRQIDYKKPDLESVIAKRRDVLVRPIMEDVGKAIDEFGKKNAYGAIFDVSKMAESGALIYLADATNVTKEFVLFYNARAASVPIAK